MTEILYRAKAHVVKRKECRRHNKIEYPLKCYSNGYSCTADGIREYFRNQNPADRTPAEHKRSTVDHYAYHSNNRRYRCSDAGDCNSGSSYRHTYRAPYEKRLTSDSFHSEDSHESECDVHYSHNDGLEHRIGHSQ